MGRNIDNSEERNDITYLAKGDNKTLQNKCWKAKKKKKIVKKGKKINQGRKWHKRETKKPEKTGEIFPKLFWT